MGLKSEGGEGATGITTTFPGEFGPGVNVVLTRLEFVQMWPRIRPFV